MYRRTLQALVYPVSGTRVASLSSFPLFRARWRGGNVSTLRLIVACGFVKNDVVLKSETII